MPFKMLFADAQGRLFDHPRLMLAGRTGESFTEPLPEEMIPLPAGAALTLIPEGVPIGIERSGTFRPLREMAKHGPVFAVGALLPQGFTRTLLPAYRRPRGAKPLPLLGYTAVGLSRGKYYAAAVRTDNPDAWNPENYNTPELPDLVGKRVNSPNRILAQLAKCALDYGCLTAQNIFYRRWEGGLPVSPVCNANCLGCISLQPAECCPSPQERIKFVPELEEIIEVALPHLEEAPEAIISFGQGCEGEPSLSYRRIIPAIQAIRRTTARGTININTNAGHTLAIRKIAQAGLDAMRVSIIGPGEVVYNTYYRPKDYTLRQVKDSIKAAKAAGVYVSLNLLTLPGLTDREDQLSALIDLVRETEVDLIQFRNLNIDIDWFYSLLPPSDSPAVGLTEAIRLLQTELPGVELGSFSRPVR